MKIFIVFLAPVFIFASIACSSLPEVDSTPAKDIRPSAGDQKKNIILLKKHIKNNKTEDNIALIIRERSSFKGTEFETEIEQLLAQEYSKIPKYSDAGIAYLRAARSSDLVDRRYKLCQFAIKSFQKGNDWERLFKGIDYCLSNFEFTVDISREFKTLKIQALESSGANPLKIISAYVELIDLSQGDLESKNRAMTLQLVDSLNRDQLIELIGNSEFGFLRGHAAFKLAQLQLSLKDYEAAKNNFSKVIQLLPETELADVSQKKIDQLLFSSTVNASTIGVILPLSGKHASLGKKLLRGLQMGLGLTGDGESPIRLAVADSEGNPDLARKGVERLIVEDNVIAVVGSLLSKTANAVADQAQVLNVPNLALSQKSGLTDIGENIFRFGMTSEMQIRYLVRRSINDLGMRKFAILYPNDKFGVEYANLFWDEVLARGGEIRAVQSYEADESDFSSPVQRLIGTFYLEERQDEIKWASKLKNDRQKVLNLRERSENESLAPVMDFDGIFIPDGIKALGQVSAMLSYNGVKGTKLIGPNLWNNEGIIKRVANSGNQIIFVDSSPLDLKVIPYQNFIKNFKTSFNEEPGVFEIQGYESGLILAQVLAEKPKTRIEFQNKLANLSPVQGLLSPISIGLGREFSKTLFLYNIESGLIKIFSR